jgi:hypothetical protein
MELQKQVIALEFPKGRLPPGLSFEKVSDKLEELASQAKQSTKEVKEEEEMVSRGGGLPKWMTNALNLADRQQLRNVDSAEKASEDATLLLLRYLDASLISDNWKPKIDCECDSYYPDLARGIEPDCDCAEEYLEKVEEGRSKGYLLVAIYHPILELLHFAAKQEPALQERLFHGCFKSIRHVLGEMKRTKNNSTAIKTLKLLLKFENASLPKLKSVSLYY